MKKLVMMSTVALASSFMIMPSYGISCKDLEQKPKLTGINVPGSESDTFKCSIGKPKKGKDMNYLLYSIAGASAIYYPALEQDERLPYTCPRVKDDTFTFGAKRAGAQFILNNEATGGDGHFKAVPERFPDPSLPSGDGKFELGVYFVDGNNVTLKAILGGNTSIPVEVAIPCKGKPNKNCLNYIGIKREQHGTTPIYFDTTNALWCGHTDNLNNWNMYRFDVSQEE